MDREKRAILVATLLSSMMVWDERYDRCERSGVSE